MRTAIWRSPTYINLNDDTDPAKGLAFNTDPPRFSTGQMILENRPGMLVELHMLKDYKTRVTGNYEILRGAAGGDESRRRQADRAERAGRCTMPKRWGASWATKFPLAIDWDGDTTTPFLFHGYEYTRELSEVSGGMWISYTP